MGKRSRHLLGAFQNAGARILAVCAVDQSRREAEKARIDAFWACCHGQVVTWDPARNTFAGGTGKPDWLMRDYRGEWKV